MIFTDECRGCEYYNKPYWSVVSPCANCRRTCKSSGEHDFQINHGYITTTTTNLPRSEPKYRCPKCGGGMRRNEMVVLTSYPAQYEYQCDKCGHVEYQFT